MDLWSQLNQSNQEIKRNCKAFGKILKKSETKGIWKEYYGVLSGGYIYFFQDVKEDNYIAFYYLKDTELYEENETLEDGRQEEYIKLKNPNGIIKVRFPNENKKKTWLDNLRRRIFEMNTLNEIKIDELIESKLELTNEIKEIFLVQEFAF